MMGFVRCLLCGRTHVDKDYCRAFRSYLFEFVQQHREIVTFICMDDKHKVCTLCLSPLFFPYLCRYSFFILTVSCCFDQIDVGEPGIPIVTGSKDKVVLQPGSSLLHAGYHDFHKVNITPSVCLLSRSCSS